MTSKQQGQLPTTIAGTVTVTAKTMTLIETITKTTMMTIMTPNHPTSNISRGNIGHLNEGNKCVLWPSHIKQLDLLEKAVREELPPDGSLKSFNCL